MDSFIASFLALFGVDKIGKIPVGATAKSVVDWMKLHLSWLFDTISDGLGWLIDSTLNVLQSPHPLVVIAALVTAGITPGALTAPLRRLLAALAVISAAPRALSRH